MAKYPDLGIEIEEFYLDDLGDFLYDREYDKVDEAVLYGWDIATYIYLENEAKRLGIESEIKQSENIDELFEVAKKPLRKYIIQVFLFISDTDITEIHKDVGDVIKSSGLELSQDIPKKICKKHKVRTYCTHYID